MTCGLLATIMILAGCKTTQVQKTVTPATSVKTTISSYFKAVKSLDVKSMNKLSTNSLSSEAKTLFDNNSSSSTSDSGLSSSGEEEMIKAMVGKLDYQLEGEPKIEGNNASVKVKITSLDMQKIFNNIMTSAMSKAYANAEAGDDTSDASSGVEQEMEDAIKAKDASLTSTEMDLQLEKQDGQWKIKATDNFYNAITGNLFTAYKNYSSLSSSVDSEESQDSESETADDNSSDADLSVA
ncbi:MAG TPA: hypothetical protein DEP42_01890 [Ruminococcaceae bacterium]|nr:hypothetical protein [Oscillospiraceae bacterium]